MKRVYIVHGWGGSPHEPLLSWLAKELRKRGFEVIALQMPNTDEPTIDAWVSHLRGLVGKLDEHTYFIGHSIGCQTIMRYLASVPEGIKVGGCIFIAGWFQLGNLGRAVERNPAGF